MPNASRIRTRAYVIWIFIVLAYCMPASVLAYSVTLSVGVDVSRVHERNEAVLVGCSLSHSEGSVSEKQFISLSNGAFSGVVDIELEASQPLLEYEMLICDVRLCIDQTYEESCGLPISQSNFDSLTGLNSFQRRDQARLVYDESLHNQHALSQSLVDSLVMVVPPPSYQFAGDSTQQSGKSSSGSQQSNSSKGSSSGKAGRVSQSMSDGAGSVNTNVGYAETLAAIVVFAVTKNTAALTDAATGSLGVVTNAVFGQVNETSIGIVGDLAGLSISLGGAALSGGAAAGSVAAAGAAGLALPLLGAASAGAALGTKLNKALDEPLLRALEGTLGYDDEDPEGYREAVAAMERRKAAKKAAAAGLGTGANDSASSASMSSSGGGSPDSSTSTSPANNAGEAAAVRAAEQVGRRRAGGSETPSEEPSEAAVGGADTESGSLYFDVEGEVVDVETGVSEGAATIEVWMTQAEIDAGTSGSGDSGSGAAGSSSAQGNSDSTGTSSDGNGASAGSDSDGESGDDSSGDSESDDSDSSDCSEEGGAGCDNESEQDSSEDDSAETAESDTAENSTPDPRDRDNMGAGLAWAMKNPDNPMAQSILAAAAQSVEESSGGCQTGCAEAKSKGGLLWAMSNPDNPMAQQILADAATAVSDNSGSGQTGGVDDNPSNEPVNAQASDEEIRRIELLIAGGGVVDPPEESSGNGGGENPLTGEGPPITGGNPVSADQLEIHGSGAHGMGDGGPADPEDPEGGLSVDTEQIRAGGFR